MNDFKIPKKFLSISDFSKLSGISRKNLIYYDNSYLAEGIKNVDKLNEFMEKNQLIPTGDVYIENIADEMITKSQDKYLSKISIQVSKKRH